MKDFILIGCGAGLQDGLNPCIFMTCAFFIAHGIWLKRKSIRLGWLRVFFVMAYWASFLLLNFGPGQYIVYHKKFVLIARIIYFALGVLAFILGVLFFKDWILLRRETSSGNLTDDKIKPFVVGFLDARLTTVLLAVILSALASVWPVNGYVMLLGSAAILRGQWHNGMMLLLVYSIVMLWPLWIVWAFLAIKNLKPSLLKIFCSFGMFHSISMYDLDIKIII